MVKISIICLIYRSKKFADWVYNSLVEFTPLLKNGNAEFFFVANDPTNGIIEHLNKREYPYIINNNIKYSDQELFEAGYAKPEYISRVYRGYNKGIMNAKGEFLVLINSDNYFSPDWLENLIKYYDRSKIITSKIVERSHPEHSFFPQAYNFNFGDSPENFRKYDFLRFVAKYKKTGLEINGAYMPCLLSKDIAFQAGLYPEGNIAEDNFEKVKLYGDEAFYKKLSKLGVTHLTALDSIVYHLKEGETDETINFEEEQVRIPNNKNKLRPYKELDLIALTNYITPCFNHTNIINSLIANRTINRKKELFKTIKKNKYLKIILRPLYKLLLKINVIKLFKKYLKI